MIAHFLATQMLTFLYAASLDYAGIGSLIAAVAAAIALFLGHRNSKQSNKTVETVSYVDTNLKTMQLTLEWLKNDNVALREDNVALREENESQREQIAAITDELETVEAELAQCKEMCALIKGRLDDELGDNREPK